MASSPDRFATVGVSGDGGGGLGLFSLLEAAAQPSNTRGAVLWAKAQAADGDGRLPATFLGKLPGARKATRLVKAEDVVAALEGVLTRAKLVGLFGDAAACAALAALMVRGAYSTLERTASVATESTRRLVGGWTETDRMARPAAERTASVATESTMRLDVGWTETDRIARPARLAADRTAGVATEAGRRLEGD